jgi:hypothetical protein
LSPTGVQRQFQIFFQEKKNFGPARDICSAEPARIRSVGKGAAMHWQLVHKAADSYAAYPGMQAVGYPCVMGFSG